MRKRPRNYLNPRAVAISSLGPSVNRSTSPPPAQKPPGHWLSSAALAGFAAAGTSAHRLGTTAGGWVERFAGDVLISHQDDAAREAALAGLAAWSAAHGFTAERVFGKLLTSTTESGCANAPIAVRT